jgi:hypothetical protein
MPRPKGARNRALPPVQRIACPSCAAPIGAPCTTSKGTLKRNGHAARRRLAGLEVEASGTPRARRKMQVIIDARQGG